MIQIILAFFGYVKVPKSAIELCILLEDDFKKLAKIAGRRNLKVKSQFEYHQRVIRTLKEFLQIGRTL